MITLDDGELRDGGKLRDGQSICGVIDLINGKAVAAVGGRREQYQPIASIDGDAVELAQHYCRLGCGGLYVADLDGIASGNRNRELVERLAKIASQSDQPLWYDAGYRGCVFDEMNEPAFAPVRWIIATETGITHQQGAQLCEHLGPDRVAISLDFQDHRFLGQELGAWRALLEHRMASTAIVLNLGDVGMHGGGSMDEWLVAIRRQCPQVHLIGGGGVRDNDDVNRLRSLGCDQVLVATAIRP